MNSIYDDKLKYLLDNIGIKTKKCIIEKNFSIHTFCIRWELKSKQEYDNLFKIIRQGMDKYNCDCQKNYEYHSNSRLDYSVFKFLREKYGINRIELRQYKYNDGFYRYFLDIVINAGKLMNEFSPHIRLISMNKMPELTRRFDEIMIEEFANFEYKFRDGNMHRIDATTTLKFDTDEMAKKYISILKQLNIPYKFKREPESTLHGKNRILLKNKRIEMDIYLKKEEMEWHKDHFTEDDLNFSTGCIRFEIRFERMYINIVKKKILKPYMSEEYLLEMMPSIACYKMVKILNKCFGTGDFYNIESVKETIYKAIKNENVIRRMIALVDLTRKYKSLDDAIEELSEIEGKPNIKYALNRFNDLKISPITTDSDKKLSNPIKMINKKNVRFIKKGSKRAQ